MKQSIAIMMYYMNCGGVENALVELLKNIDQERYTVDLFMLEKTGVFLNRIPSWVNIRELGCSRFDKEYLVDQSLKHLLKKGIEDKSKFVKSVYYLIKSLFFRVFGEQAVAYRCVFGKKIYGSYDFAFDFHGYLSLTTYFLSQNISAKRKSTWIHSEAVAKKAFTMKRYLSDYNDIFCVSDRCTDLTKKSIPQLAGKVQVFRNFIDENAIIRAAEVGSRLPKSKGELCLLTVGRLTYPKGYDIAIQSAAILRDKGVRFKWFFCGDGEEKEKLRCQIKSNNLENYIILLGFQNNPYGYMRSCDLYIQPSRYEGYAVTIVEASILGCTIISTDVSGAKEEIKEKKQGIVVDISAKSIASAIIEYCCVERSETKFNKSDRNNASRELLDSVLCGSKKI